MSVRVGISGLPSREQQPSEQALGLLPTGPAGWLLIGSLSCSLPAEMREAIQRVREQAGSWKLGLLLIGDLEAPEACLLISLADWKAWYGEKELDALALAGRARDREDCERQSRVGDGARWASRQ